MSNIAESYNSMLKGVKGLLICPLVKRTFYNYVIHWKKGYNQATKVIKAKMVFMNYVMEMIDKWRAKSNTHKVVGFCRSLRIVVRGGEGNELKRLTLGPIHAVATSDKYI